MGTYSPAPVLTRERLDAARQRLIEPALKAMTAEGTPYRGVLYAGLTLTGDGPKLVEFNARFGDPECQVLLSRLKSDLLPALQAACDGELRDFDIRRSDQAVVAVVVAARGYPDAPERGSVIGGNVWLTRSVPAGSRLTQARVRRDDVFNDGGGI